MNLDLKEMLLIYTALSEYRSTTEQDLSEMPLSDPDRAICQNNLKETNALMRKIKATFPPEVIAMLKKNF